MAKKHAHVPVVEAPQIEDDLPRLSESGIVIPEPGEMRRYLQGHPDMSGLLLPVCKLASERFGPGTQLSLELYRDPEIEDEYLTLYVRQENYDEDILETIDTIRGEPTEDLSPSSGWLLVTTDYRPPR